MPRRVDAASGGGAQLSGVSGMCVRAAWVAVGWGARRCVALRGQVLTSHALLQVYLDLTFLDKAWQVRRRGGRVDAGADGGRGPGGRWRGSLTAAHVGRATCVPS